MQNDGLESRYKQWLDAGATVLYTLIKAYKKRVASGAQLKENVVFFTQHSHIIAIKLVYSPSASPSAVCSFMLPDMRDGRSVIFPSRNTPFNSLVFNNENINCTSLKHECFWWLILSVLHNAGLIKWTHFLWWVWGK